MSVDATAILAILKCVCKHYELDYGDVCKIANVSSNASNALNASNAPSNAEQLELEFITINKKNYLHHPKTNSIYTNESKPRRIGHLCQESFQVILDN